MNLQEKFFTIQHTDSIELRNVLKEEIEEYMRSFFWQIQEVFYHIRNIADDKDSDKWAFIRMNFYGCDVARKIIKSELRKYNAKIEVFGGDGDTDWYSKNFTIRIYNKSIMGTSFDLTIEIPSDFLSQIESFDIEKFKLDVEREYATFLKEFLEKAIITKEEQIKKLKTEMGIHTPPIKFINHCDQVAIEALEYLASHPRPSYGNQSFNSEHLYQIAHELKKSLL